MLELISLSVITDKKLSFLKAPELFENSKAFLNAQESSEALGAPDEPPEASKWAPGAPDTSETLESEKC